MRPASSSRLPARLASGTSEVATADPSISRRSIARLALAAPLLAAIACGHGATGTTPDRAAAARVANLHAFARLYGVVRWFHPSDAAAAIDWERFAVDGAHQVIDAPDVRALHAQLSELFAPIAPTLQIIGPGEAFTEPPALHPPSTVDLELVAWQHKGYGDSAIATGYVSKRLHRDRTIALSGPPFAALSQSLDAAPFRGARVRLRGKLRTADHGRAQLWLRVDRGDTTGFFDNMTRHPVFSETWTDAEIVGTVPGDATRIVFGVLQADRGTAWYDDLELSVESSAGTWAPVSIQDGGFESPDPFTSWHPGNGRLAATASIESWKVIADHRAPASGAAALRIERATTLVTSELFDQAPTAGEAVTLDLGSGLRARVPIALYSKNGQTIGDNPDVARRTQLTPRRAATGFDPVTSAADVIVYWNTFEHFWPYWNTVAVDRNAMLDAGLAAALDNRTIDDHLATLEWVSASAPDGHVALSCPGEREYAYPPFAVDLVESQIVVTTSTDPAIQRGDVIVSVDGRPATQLFTAELAFLTGSPQWRTVRAARRLGRGPPHTMLGLRLLRDQQEISVTAARIDRSVPEEPLHPSIAPLEDGIYYIDLSHATLPDLEAIVDRLAAAPGIVFDLRGYPRGNHDILSHALTHLDDLRGWESIPLIIRPDTASTPSAWEDTATWNMPLLSVKQPHFTGRFAFLTGPGAISYAESVMALVEHYHLGPIVGAPTAGTNGDIVQLDLPTGCFTRFTGRRVTKPDGSQHHLIGIQPTIPASRTIAGIRAGRDDVLERALAALRGDR
jgi:C-terminal processing protease CtpA/Prc